MNPWSGLKNLPREVWLICVSVLINRAGTMVLPFLVLYLTRDLHFPVAKAGLMIALYGVGAMITAPVSGFLADRFGALRIMKVSLFLSALVFFAFPLARTFAGIICVTILLAITNEMFRPAGLAAISHSVSPEQRKAAFALNRLAINLGMSIGPAIGGFLATLSFQFLFVIDGATSLLAGIVLAFFSLHLTSAVTDSEAGMEEKPAPAQSRRAFSDLQFLYFLLATVFVTIVFFQHLAAMPLFMVRNLHLSEAAYGLMFTINTGLIVLLEVPLNLRISRWSHRTTLALGSFLCAAGFGSFAFAGGIGGVVIALIVWTAGEMMLFPGMSAYVSHIASSERQGEYMGFYTMAFSIAFIIGPWMGTELLERFGAQVLWAVMFLIGSISAIMMFHLRDPSRAAS